MLVSTCVCGGGGASLRAVTAGPPGRFSVRCSLSEDPAFSEFTHRERLVCSSLCIQEAGDKNQQTSDLLANSVSIAKLSMAHTDGQWGLQGPLTAILKDSGEAAPSLL